MLLCHTNIIPMGMKLKPSKCRSLSITSGKSSDIPYFIDEYRIPSIRDEEQMFLGKLLFFTGNQEYTYYFIYNTFKDGLDKIQNTMIRNEYKLWIYREYFLPSKRFLLTVHNITSTNLTLLDWLTSLLINGQVCLHVQQMQYYILEIQGATRPSF